MDENKFNKSISELENWKWNEDIPTTDDSFVIRNFYRLHNIPISDYLLADFRFMIGQNTGLDFLVPLALKKLQENIFIEADLYPGDLLCSLFLIDEEPNYWQAHEEEKQELIRLYSEQKRMLGVLDVSEEIKVKIKKAYKEFAK